MSNFATPWTIAHQPPLSMGILQARKPEWVAMPSSRGSSQPRDGTQVFRIAGRFFTESPGKPKKVFIISFSVTVKVAQSCLTLYDLMDYSPPASSVHGDSPGNNTGVGCHALLQGIFPTQESNRSLLHCRWIIYQMSYQELVDTSC